MHVDLSHSIETDMQTYPGDPAVVVGQHANHDDDGVHVEAIECGSHTGTHVDAPLHTEPDGKSLTEFSVERFVFDAVRVDCRDIGAREPIPAARIPTVDADLVAFWTGWDTHWGTDRYLEHPYLSTDAAETCVQREFDIAVDTLNPDPTPTETASGDIPDGFGVHHALLGNELLILENLTNLGTVESRFELRAYPMAIGSDGAPVRAIGVDMEE